MNLLDNKLTDDGDGKKMVKVWILLRVEDGHEIYVESQKIINKTTGREYDIVKDDYGSYIVDMTVFVSKRIMMVTRE